MGKIMYKNINYSGASGSGGGFSGIELTQAEYDALVTAGTVKPDVMYFITDGDSGSDIEEEFHNAGIHNSRYRGKFLGNSVTSEQYTRISDGTFKDMYIGDYWTINNVNWRIAAFDYYLNTGDTLCTTHHVTIVPDTVLYNACMESSTGVSTKPYINQSMYTSGLNEAKSIINTAFGSEHILSHRQALCNTVSSTHYETGQTWVDSTVILMTEQNLVGTSVLGNHVSVGNTKKETLDYIQFPLFRYNPSLISTGGWWWLRNYAFSSNNTGVFSMVSNTGCLRECGAHTEIGVRPSFSIKA